MLKRLGPRLRLVLILAGLLPLLLATAALWWFVPPHCRDIRRLSTRGQRSSAIKQNPGAHDQAR